MQLILKLMFSVRHCIGGIMVRVLASNAVDRGFEPRSSQTKDYKIGICCFSAKYAALRRTSRDWLARNHNNVSEWSDMYTRGLLFQWTSTIKMQLSVLVLIFLNIHKCGHRNVLSKRQVWMSIFHIINFKKKNHGRRGPGFF